VREVRLIRTASQNKSTDFRLRLELCANVAKRYNDAVGMTHAYEVRPRKDHCGVDLISDALPFAYDNAGNVIETHEQAENGS
jgi:hypothetical protein